MKPYRDLRVLQAAEDMVIDVIRLLDARPARLLFRAQLRDCAQGVPSNIGEAFGEGRSLIAIAFWESREGKRKR
jgi:hypothetical protein